MRRLIVALSVVLAMVGLMAVAGAAWFATTGISTRTNPSRLETTLARSARHFLIPAAARARTNPEGATPEVLEAGLEHWADHCATCHGNDGGGQTTIGEGLYPRVPDMRLPETQQLSDGELFYIIEHGVKLTGMPAWGDGTAEGERSSWHLVHFIRRLPSLTEDELSRMEAFNPKSEEEWRALEEERRFLSGEQPLSGDMARPPADAGHAHKGHKQ
jgi:mono/diheme cytochrome c family protein